MSLLESATQLAGSKYVGQTAIEQSQQPLNILYKQIRQKFTVHIESPLHVLLYSSLKCGHQASVLSSPLNKRANKQNSLEVVFAGTFRIGSSSMSTYCMYTRANSCVDRLKAKGGRDAPSIHG